MVLGLLSSLPLANAILETTGKNLGEKPLILFRVQCMLCSQWAKCAQVHISSATDTAIHVHSQVCRNGSEHHVLGDLFPFTFCVSLCLGLSLAIISAQLEQLQDFLSV